MKFENFIKTDTLYIDLKETNSIDSKEIANGIVLDFDESGEMTGIEIDQHLPTEDLVFA